VEVVSTTVRSISSIRTCLGGSNNSVSVKVTA
jgi:hypothetical protein